MSADKLMVATWKISGVQAILHALQTSEDFENPSDENLFFILSNELTEALNLLKETSS